MNNELPPTYTSTITINDFIDESKPFVESYICPLCEGILYDSVIDKCGHSFCKKCSVTLLKSISQCPYTHEPLIPPLSQNIIVNSIMEKQHVFCKNKKMNCNWEGKLSDLFSHLSSKCPKEPVPCSASKCDACLPREEMKRHWKKCPKRTTLCEFCKKEINYIKRNKHYENCPNSPVECTNKCGMIVSLKTLEKHKNDECNNSKTICPFDILGCEFNDIRKELKVHLDKDIERHLRMLTDEIDGMQTKLDKQGEDLLSISQESTNLKNGFANMQSKFTESEKEILERVNVIKYSHINSCNIPFSNLIPNFYDIDIPKSKANIFILDRENFVIKKINDSEGWYGLISLNIINDNNSMYGSFMLISYIEEKIIINLKIICTANSCIMFGLTQSNLKCPLEKGYYCQKEKNNNSLIFYCFNCSVYQNGVPIAELEKDKKCVEGDIISLIIDRKESTVEFRRNGKVMHEKFPFNIDSKSVKVCIDLSDIDDTVMFLN